MNKDVELSIDGLDIHDEPLWKVYSDMKNNYYNGYAASPKHVEDFQKILIVFHAWYPEKEEFVKTFIDECLDKEYHEAEKGLNGEQVLLYNIKRDLLSGGYDSNYKGETYKLNEYYDVDIEYAPLGRKFTIDITGTDEDGITHEYISAIPEEELLKMDYKTLMSCIGTIMNGPDWEEERRTEEAAQD